MRAYQDMVFSTAARLTGEASQAEDIAQEVFLKAYQHFDHLRGNAAAGGWLKAVATNLTLNHLSRYRRRWRFFSDIRRTDEDEQDPVVDIAVPDTLLENLDADTRSARIEQAIRRLPEHRRVPLVLYHFEDMSYEEIARRLRVSLSKVKTDILRARTALAKALTQP